MTCGLPPGRYVLRVHGIYCTKVRLILFSGFKAYENGFLQLCRGYKLEISLCRWLLGYSIGLDLNVDVKDMSNNRY